ncbi:hypothetical protein PCANC_09501 [Puccinia coronata f. sp. avenae]|uniref:Uncharacterized protein n=1 Tax=Puccinia coronata f. sp. avenae TaxID=200324 RepID=A0A2N5VVP1_9BASI|nr:hypothetical protein PCANC_09501 [Puccinia coronata f. sp. avenae]
MEYSTGHPGGPLTAFKHVLAFGLMRLNGLEKVEVGDTWEHYVIADAASDCVKIRSSSARGQKAFSNFGRKDLFEDASRITLRALADQLKNLYIHYSEDSAFWDKKSSLHEIIDQLSPWEEEHLTPDSWGLSVRFYHLSMMWKRRIFLHDIVTQMAIFGHFGKDPNPIPETITQKLGGRINQIDKAAIKSVYKWVQLPCQYDEAGELNNAIEQIIPKPHDLSITHISNMSNGIKRCSQEYFAVTEFILVCRKQAPMMNLKHPTFWKDLEKIADEENLKPVMQAFQDLCLYFQNGTPLGRTFEYYQMVSRITHEFKQLNMNKTQIISHTQLDHLSQDANEIVESIFLYERVNLLLNYAAELDQFRKSNKIDIFQPSPRATKSQIEHLSTQICMIFSQKFDTEEEGLDWMDETFFQLNDAVVHSQLPSMIKDRVDGIAVVLTTLMGVYLLGGWQWKAYHGSNL